MENGVTKGLRRKIVLAGLIIAVILPLTSVLFGTDASAEDAEDNNIEQQEAQTESADQAETEIQAAAALPTMEQEQPVVESSKEIVNDSLLSDVPAADYSYSFDGKLDNAVAVTRSGDEGGFNTGTYPEYAEAVQPLFTDGMEGDALYLDGTYGVELLGVENLADSYTISFWMKAEQLCDWSPFLVIGSNLLDVDGTQNYLSLNKKSTEEGEAVVPVFNTVNCVYDNSCEIRPSSENKQCVNLGEWTYITICVDGTQVSESDSTKVTGYLYVNSELVGCGEVSKLELDTANLKAYVGINCFDELYKAVFDEIHIWNSLLSESQISAMYVAYLQN
jgi:hypothetical protein